jgi:competence protein ComEC
VTVWTDLLDKNDNTLTVAFLDIGQGDAIYIQAPNGTQMLVDGARNDLILDKLNQIMPYGDRSLDIVLATHQDSDHIGGLPYVLEKYEVSKIFDNGKVGKSQTETLKKFEQDISDEIKTAQAEYIHASQGMRIILDKKNNIYFDILYPATNSTSTETNDMSVVGRLVYGETEFILTGDSPIGIEEKLTNWCKECLKSDVLKVGHHGSKTSTNKAFLDAVSPVYAVISAGKDNSYGHPHKTVMDRLRESKIKILETSKIGNIIFESDGKTISNLPSSK